MNSRENSPPGSKFQAFSKLRRYPWSLRKHFEWKLFASAKFWQNFSRFSARNERSSRIKSGRTIFALFVTLSRITTTLFPLLFHPTAEQISFSLVSGSQSNPQEDFRSVRWRPNQEAVSSGEETGIQSAGITFPLCDRTRGLKLLFINQRRNKEGRRSFSREF